MDLSQIKTSVRKAGTATVTDIDFSRFSNSVDQFPILNGWASHGAVRDVASAYSWAVEELPKVEKIVETINQDKDLTTEAKARRIDTEVGAMMTGLENRVKAVNAAATGAMTAAGNVLTPAKPIPKGDAVQAVLDVELRTFLRQQSEKDRQEIMGRLLQGEHPDLAQAVLRANPLLCGVKPSTAQALWGAGVVAAHRDEVIALGMFAKALRDVKQSMSSVAASLANAARGAEAGRIKARSEALYFNFGAVDELVDFMKRFPVNLNREELGQPVATAS